MWKGFDFKIVFKGRTLKIQIDERLRIDLLEGQALEIEIYNKRVEVKDTLVVDLKS